MAEVADVVGALWDPKRIQRPGRYFRIGRVFATRWTEPSSAHQENNSTALEKIRRFIVVHEAYHMAWCVPIYTYGGRGFHKPGIKLQDHAQIYNVDGETVERQAPLRDPIGMVVEGDTDIHRLHPASVANFGKINSIEPDTPVMNVGFVPKAHINRLALKFNDLVVSTSKTKMKMLRRDEGLFNLTVEGQGNLEIGELDLGYGGSLNLSASGTSEVKIGSIKEKGTGFVTMRARESASLKLGHYNCRGPLRTFTEDIASLSIENADINDSDIRVTTAGQSGTTIANLRGCDGSFDAKVNDRAKLELNTVDFLQGGTFRISSTSQSTSEIKNFHGDETIVKARLSDAAWLRMGTVTLANSIIEISSKELSNTFILNISSVSSILRVKNSDSVALRIDEARVTTSSWNLVATGRSSTSSIGVLRASDSTFNSKLSASAGFRVDKRLPYKSSPDISSERQSPPDTGIITCAGVLDADTPGLEDGHNAILPPDSEVGEPSTRTMTLHHPREPLHSVSADSSVSSLMLLGESSTIAHDGQSSISSMERSCETVMGQQGPLAVMAGTDLAQVTPKGDIRIKMQPEGNAWANPGGLDTEGGVGMDMEGYSHMEEGSLRRREAPEEYAVTNTAKHESDRTAGKQSADLNPLDESWEDIGPSTDEHDGLDEEGRGSYE
ncbi:hypothetical protein PG985_015858 [Apiospora marii]|uniref:DUF6590 domain-containing protein n=1 Tax=Apiospora marii TaxID=335849 RepID=A0ABR1S5X6_9PEZI